MKVNQECHGKFCEAVVIADDHPVFRAGLAQVIQNEPELRLAGEASDGAVAWQLIQTLTPAVAVVDIEMPKMDGLQLARAVQQQRLPTGLVLLTMHKKESFLREALDLGVKGYLLKDNAIGDIVQSVRTVASGQSYISPLMSSFLLQRAQQARRLIEAKPRLGRQEPAQFG